MTASSTQFPAHSFIPATSAGMKPLTPWPAAWCSRSSCRNRFTMACSTGFLGRALAILVANPTTRTSTFTRMSIRSTICWQSSINYFNALVRHDSQDDERVQQVGFAPNGNNNLLKTQEYARLFMVPGMYHCSGGPGPNVFDAITPLRKWVEQGLAPETIIATNGVMTRPLCVFPKVAKFNGIGVPNVYTSFTCVADEPDFNQTPAPKYGP